MNVRSHEQKTDEKLEKIYLSRKEREGRQGMI
jgi:hypothetical protein